MKMPEWRIRRMCFFAGTLLLAGCAGFFDKPTTTATGSGGNGGGATSSAGDYVYVVNQTSATLTGYAVGGGTLASVAGSPYTVSGGVIPSSVVVSRQNNFVFVGGAEAIVCYSIGTGGALTAVTGGGASALANFVAMDVSPDGNWLLALDSASQAVFVYGINATTGVLTLNTTTPYNAPPASGTLTPRAIRIAPNGAIVAAALGFGGDALFTFNTTTGVLTSAASLSEPAGFSDNAVAFDSRSAFLYIARAGVGTSGVASYSVNATTAALTSAQTLAASGSAPAALLFDSSGGFLYAANRGNANITGYTVSAGTLTALASSPYRSGNSVDALTLDNSGRFVIAAASGGSSDLTLYGFDALTAGQLDPLATAASGSAAIAIAATH